MKPMTSHFETVVRSFSAPRPLVEAINAEAAARGITVSSLIREAVLAQGVGRPEMNEPASGETDGL
jgi:Ribbon-helix-helix protein, copG family